MSEMKTYKAKERGYDGRRVIEAGEVFTTDIKQGSWMEPVEMEPVEGDAKKAKPAPAKE